MRFSFGTAVNAFLIWRMYPLAVSASNVLRRNGGERDRKLMRMGARIRPNSVSLGGVPISFPLIRIDYIWSAGGVVPIATRIACSSESDHCLVIADIQVGNVAAE
jgi:hypothetical protein